MKKRITNTYFLWVVLLFVITACTDDTIYTKLDKPLVSLEQSSYTMTEGDDLMIAMVTDNPYKEAMDFKLELIGGTGNNEDFAIDASSSGIEEGSTPAYIIQFPAYATSYQFQLSALQDILPEQTETLRLKLTSTRNGNGLVAEGSDIISINIENATSDDLYLELNWDGIYTDSDGEEHDLCDVDFDMELYDVGGNLLTASYSSCPESITIPFGALPDGDYFVFVELWSNNGIDTPANIDYTLHLIYSKPGVYIDNIDLSGIFNSTDGGNVEGNPNWYTVINLNISGSTYTISQ